MFMEYPSTWVWIFYKSYERLLRLLLNAIDSAGGGEGGGNFAGGARVNFEEISLNSISRCVPYRFLPRRNIDHLKNLLFSQGLWCYFHIRARVIVWSLLKKRLRITREWITLTRNHQLCAGIPHPYWIYASQNRCVDGFYEEYFFNESFTV